MTPLLAGAAAALISVTALASPRQLRREIAPCDLDRVQGKVDCGVFEVYENPEDPAGRPIPLYFVVLRALEPPARPDPIFGFAGGPGVAEASLAWAWDEGWHFARKTRDIVLFDQRGSGKSNPLSCALPEKEPALSFQHTLFPPELVKRCRDRLSGIVDLTRYTTPYAAADVEQLRQWLGYDRINLWAESYGTRPALEYARRFRDHVRAVVVDGVAGFDLKMPLYFASDAQRALDGVLTDCERDNACHAAFPDVRREFQSLVRRISTKAVTVVLHDKSGRETGAMQLTRAGFGYAIRGMLYGPSALRLPMLIHRAYKDGDWEPFGTAYLRRGSWFGRDDSGGMYLSIVCAEDVPTIKNTEVATATRGTFLGDALIRQYRDACALWPHGHVDAGYNSPPRSDVPALLLSGGRDPVTPPAVAIRQAAALTNSVHFVVPQGGHGVATFPCAEKLIADFLDVGRTPATLPTCEGEKTGAFVIHE